MNRRQLLLGLVSAPVSACLKPALAYAQSVADPVIRALKRQGYGDIRIGRTWLGRVRITAERGKRHREIILDHRTGEVLRDVVYRESGETHSGFEDNNDESHENHSGDNSGPGDDDGDDKDDNHEDDDSDDDHEDDGSDDDE